MDNGVFYLLEESIIEKRRRDGIERGDEKELKVRKLALLVFDATVPVIQAERFLQVYYECVYSKASANEIFVAEEVVVFVQYEVQPESSGFSGILVILSKPKRVEQNGNEYVLENEPRLKLEFDLKNIEKKIGKDLTESRSQFSSSSALPVIIIKSVKVFFHKNLVFLYILALINSKKYNILVILKTILETSNIDNSKSCLAYAPLVSSSSSSKMMLSRKEVTAHSRDNPGNRREESTFPKSSTYLKRNKKVFIKKINYSKDNLNTSNSLTTKPKNKEKSKVVLPEIVEPSDFEFSSHLFIPRKSYLYLVELHNTSRSYRISVIFKDSGFLSVISTKRIDLKGFQDSINFRLCETHSFVDQKSFCFYLCHQYSNEHRMNRNGVWTCKYGFD